MKPQLACYYRVARGGYGWKNGFVEQDFLLQALSQPKHAIKRALSALLRERFPNVYVLETGSAWFQPLEFAGEGLCTVSDASSANDWQWEWDAESGSAMQRPSTALLAVKWGKHEYQLATVNSFSDGTSSRSNYLIAKNRQAAEAFFSAVCNWVAEVRAEILLFQDGHWQKSEQLFTAIKAASLDNLVLPGKMKESIVSDFTKFFESRETYDQYRIAWKRGVLFIGPPGNGKTHMVKALLNDLQRPCLYVRSFSALDQTSDQCISHVFRRARETAPCVLVLEDLDSLVDDNNRSLFLNEMDGFYTNEGILTVATTNHPERLDPAILERPSRFDRKYSFALPAFEERRKFLELYNESVEPALQLNPDSILRVAFATNGFSYAYLKELFLSAMMSFMAEEATGTLGGHMISHADALREQMRTSPDSVMSLNGEARDAMRETA